MEGEAKQRRLPPVLELRVYCRRLGHSAQRGGLPALLGFMKLLCAQHCWGPLHV